MTTVAEIKHAVRGLPRREKMVLAKWLRAQTDDRLSDEALMETAAAGARALDARETAYAKRKAR